MGNNNVTLLTGWWCNFFTVLQREKAITAIAAVTVKKGQRWILKSKKKNFHLSETLN